MDNQFLPIEPKKDTTLANKRQIERGAVSKAVYMVTDLFDDKEPLKQALREAAVYVLQNQAEGGMVRLKSLLVLSKEVGLVSSINTEILLRAINTIEEAQCIRSEALDISNVLKVEKVEEMGASVREEMNDEVTETVEGRDPSITPSQPTERVERPVSNEKVDRPVQASSTVATLDIGARRKKILEVVRSKGQATIHEFVQSIQGCSSKTIQRELTSLVLSGTLKKTGERRWSKYSLR
jgi:hypothetical protein